MKISVVTPTFNSANTIRRTYESILIDQELIEEWIIVDSYSADKTVDMVKSEFKTKFPIKVVQCPPNGPYDAMNIGIEHATGAVIAILNSDDAWTGSNARIALDCFQTQNADVVFGRVNLVDNLGSHLLVGNECFAELKRFKLNELHPAVFVKKKIYEKFGCFDASYRINADLEFLLRLKKAGITIVFSNKIIVDYYEGGISSIIKPDHLSFFRMFFALKLPVKWLVWTFSRHIYSYLPRWVQKVIN